MRVGMSSKIIQKEDLFSELSALIDQTRSAVAVQANYALTLLFWKIGRRVNEEILQNKRAEYGGQIVVTLSRQLAEKYGRNFEEKNFRRMLQFAEQFQDDEIVDTLARQLSWSHFLALLPLKSPEARLFYARQTAAGSLASALCASLSPVRPLSVQPLPTLKSRRIPRCRPEPSKTHIFLIFLA